MDLTYEAGTLLADRNERVVTGTLVPYNEVCRSNLGRFSVDTGVFQLPADVSILNANVDHDAEQPVARFLETQDTAKGLVAKFKIADGEEGDAPRRDRERRAQGAERRGEGCRDPRRQGDRRKDLRRRLREGRRASERHPHGVRRRRPSGTDSPLSTSTA